MDGRTLALWGQNPLYSQAKGGWYIWKFFFCFNCSFYVQVELHMLLWAGSVFQHTTSWILSEQRGLVFCPFVALGTIEYVRIRMNHRGIRWRRRNWRKRPGRDLIEGGLFWHRNLDGHPKKGHLRFSARVAARAGSHGLSRFVRHLWLANNWKKQIQNLTSFWFRQRDFDYKSADVRSSNS